MHNLLHTVTTVILLSAVALACRSASAQEANAGFEGWNLEPGVGQAHLIMVARVSRVSRVTVVEGAKTDVALREYRFQPVKLLKGIFQRDELSMTASDLGLGAEDASSPPPLKEGEFRLLILVQPRGIESYGCVSAAPGATTFEERVPLLTGPDDALVGVAETLIQVADSRSRRERAKLLVERLAETRGVTAVPLLTSLKLRADWLADDGLAYFPIRQWRGAGPNPGVLAYLARDPSPAVRGGALEVLREVLASGIIPEDPKQIDSVAVALRVILESDEANTQIRVAAIDALGHLLAMNADLDWARELLSEQVKDSATHAERAAAVTALSRTGSQSGKDKLLGPYRDAMANLPLDESPTSEAVYARAAIRLMPSDERRLLMGDIPLAERVWLKRLERSMAARQSLATEVDTLGQMRSKKSLPLLIAAASLPNLSAADRRHLARALGRLADDQAVPVLIGWLRGNDYQLKEIAFSALENVDSQIAAQESRPLLKSESHLPFKLRIARLLARHGFVDGYSLATEHLADADHAATATLVLVALDDPRTANDLSAILATRPDRKWHAAALTGLAAIGDAAALQQLLDILNDDRHPLSADAAEAAGLASDSELLIPLAKLVQSRNKQIALASLLALRRFLSDVRSSPRGLAAANLDDADSLTPAAEVPAETRADLAEVVASLVADAYVEVDVRQQALAVARLLGGEQYSELLSELADQAELEGTPLLAAVQKERHRQAERRVGQAVPDEAE